MATEARSHRIYTNARVRVRPEQLDYLDDLLHRAWVDTSQIRARIKIVLDSDHENDLVHQLNSEMRLITSIQEELKRARDDLTQRS